MPRYQGESKRRLSNINNTICSFGAKSSNPFVLNWPMGEQDYGQQPLIITNTEPTKESPPTAPTKEMAGCKISKAADPVARGIRNQRSRVPVTPEQRTARNKKPMRGGGRGRRRLRLRASVI